MSFKPLHDRVVVRRVEEDQRTAGGIIIPDNAKEKPQQGEVIAVGPGARNEQGQLIPLDVKVGDMVLFGKWSGTEVKINGEELLIMKESDIMGVIEGVAAPKAAPKAAAKAAPKAAPKAAAAAPAPAKRGRPKGSTKAAAPASAPAKRGRPKKK